jgi:sarcosine oxidase
MRTDVAVLGLGAMGSATLYQLARRGVAALGIDRYAPPHAMGSTHGETRITRCAVGEGDCYVPLVQRSHEIWRELEAETGQPLLETCGLLMMAPRGVETGHHGKTNFLNRTIAVARCNGIQHEVLDSAQIGARYPSFGLKGDEEGYFEPGGGFVRPEACVAAQLSRATELGARIRTGCEVKALTPGTSGVLLETSDGPVTADRVVVSAGAWSGRLLGGPFRPRLVPRRQLLHWFPVADESRFAPSVFPAYIWMHGATSEDYFYGFPALSGSGVVKVASEQYVDECDPDLLERKVEPEDSRAMFEEHVAGRLKGVSAGPARAAACMYTVTPDSDFVIDHHPDSERIIVVSACSGHGFKHSAAIGEAVAELTCDGRTALDLHPFRSGRFSMEATV